MQVLYQLRDAYNQHELDNYNELKPDDYLQMAHIHTLMNDKSGLIDLFNRVS